MADSSTTSIRALELRLLRCSLSPPTNDTCSHHTTTKSIYLSLAEKVVSFIEKGDYVGVLSSDAARLVFEIDPQSWDFEDSIDSADTLYVQIQEKVDSFLITSTSAQEEEEEASSKVFLLMCIAVATFLCFIQNNITGPYQSFPSFPFSFLLLQEDSIGAEWDRWAHNQLMSTGSDLLGKFSLLQYIVYAKILLMKTKDFLAEEKATSFAGIRSISWWLSRVILLQQRILDEGTSSLFDLLQVLKVENLNFFGEEENVKHYWGTLLQEGEALTIVSVVHLEAGIMEHNYGRVDHSRKHFDTAEVASGLQLSVTGVLGFRTSHQVEAKAQSVLAVDAVTPCIGGLHPRRSSEIQRDDPALGDDEASHILMTPLLLENKTDSGLGVNGAQNGGTVSTPLMAIQQALILAQCLIIEKTTPHGEMRGWDMAPFIEAIHAQESSFYIIRSFCDILRVRWECTRSHTKTRALLMMEKTVQNVYESFPRVEERISYAFDVNVPTLPALRKEFGELLVQCGLIGDALKIFEDLELWDNLIYCYCLLEKKSAAVELIKTRLHELPNDPRLWCSLGDVTNVDAYYEKALEVSNNRSARAKRSLARSAYNRGDYESSKNLWESALALNSMYPDGWFAFGAAALKARDVEKALEGFTRAVQLDPDNGEAWNNIACLHMIRNKNKEAFIAFKEALKFKRNNWQLWENYSQVAVNVGNFAQALEATKMVLNMTNNKRIDADLLERITTEIESQISKHNPPASSGDPNTTIQNHLCDSSGVFIDEPKSEDHKFAWSGETKFLMELLGKVLQQCVRGGTGGDIWGVYARWHKIKGDLTMCSEALLKQVRSYQGADLWNNKDRFKKFARASLQLSEVYMDISLATDSHRELHAAEMHLRNTIKQAADFSELEEFRALEACLEEVKNRLHQVPLPSAGNS